MLELLEQVSMVAEERRNLEREKKNREFIGVGM
jgi:hypothetical protein